MFLKKIIFKSPIKRDEREVQSLVSLKRHHTWIQAKDTVTKNISMKLRSMFNPSNMPGMKWIRDQRPCDVFCPRPTALLSTSVGSVGLISWDAVDWRSYWRGRRWSMDWDVLGNKGSTHLKILATPQSFHLPLAPFQWFCQPGFWRFSGWASEWWWQYKVGDMNVSRGLLSCLLFVPFSVPLPPPLASRIYFYVFSFLSLLPLPITSTGYFYHLLSPFDAVS